MAVFKCKMCGGELDVREGVSVLECDFCGTKQTVPTAKDEKLHGLFNRANVLRMKSEFDKAEQIYEKILQVDDTQAEAYWGLILCKYGIEYVEDPKTSTRIPTCHRTSFDSIVADDDYKSAIQYADSVQRGIYESEAKEIDRLQKEILTLSQKEEPYDVFICYKETGEDGKRTQNSVLANDIYYQLTNEGFKVFYAAITLEDKLGSAYEPCIFAALHSAKVMLAVGTKPEHFNAVWVKNEWGRFLKMMKKDRSKTLIPCYKDMDAYELPEEFAHLQAQDMAKIGFINDVVRGIKKLVAADEPQSTVVKETIISDGNANTAPLLKRVFMFLEDGEWDSADEYCEKVLDIDPECAEAYLGKLMVELKVASRQNLEQCDIPFNNRNNFQKAMRFANEDLKKELQGYIGYIKDRNAKQAEEARKENLYLKAMDDYKSYDVERIQNAIKSFTSLKGYKDSEERVRMCFEKIEQIRTKEESDRIERERLAEEKRIADEKARLEKQRQAELERIESERIAKRNKKIAMIATPIVCFIVAFVIVLTTIIIPNNKYNDAIALMDSENVVEAYEALVALDGYKDSAEKAASIYEKYKVEKLKSAKVGEYVLFGVYEQDNDTSNGKEKIEWLVLEEKDGKVLVISKYSLDCQPYNTSNTDVTWENCSIRKWLNNNFIDVAFTADEKAIIPTVTVSADKNPNYTDRSGKATQDKVYLLSISEAKKYFSSDQARKCAHTDYADAQGTVASSSHSIDGRATCWWWLRTRGDGAYAANVHDGGRVSQGGDYISNNDCGVRPAMWIDLSKI